MSNDNNGAIGLKQAVGSVGWILGECYNLSSAGICRDLRWSAALLTGSNSSRDYPGM